jgi:hypothetical protein
MQIALQLPPTRLEVMDASPERAGDLAVVEDARTEVKPISIIIPDEIAERGTLLRPRTITQADDRTGVHPSRQAVPDTIHQRPVAPVVAVDTANPLLPPPPAYPPGDTQTPRRRSPWPVVAGVGAVAVIGGVSIAALTLGGDPAKDGPATPVPTVTHSLAFNNDTPPTPTSFHVVFAAGHAFVTWENPAPQPGDTYKVQYGPSLSAMGEAKDVDVAATTQKPLVGVRVPAKRGDQVCAQVAIVRGGLVGSPLQDCGVAR